MVDSSEGHGEMPLGAETLNLDGTSLRVADVVRVARRESRIVGAVRLSETARSSTDRVRHYLECNWLTDDAPPMYGINTGLGKLKDVRVPAADLERYQQLIINAHCAGTGAPLSAEEVRAVIVLRVNALAKGVSAVRSACLDRLLDMLAADVLPIIPSQGSVGASGDLAPLAHLVSAMIGHEHAQAMYSGTVLPAAEALAAAGLPANFRLEPKDVVALINGSTVSLAVAVLALDDAWLLARTADVLLALSLEAVRGETAAFDQRIQLARNSDTQESVASNVRRLTASSERMTERARAIALPDEHRPDGRYHLRVQDAYSLRCAPQVHGASRDLLRFAEELLVREMNAATDNPLVFEEPDGNYVVLSGGNFHGQPIAFAADLVTMAVAELGSISERRSYRLTDPSMSYGLPLNLVGGMLGLNTGFSLVHCTAAALTSENKVLCFPASVDSVPTKANQEDHVSMSTYAARKARQVVANAQAILGIEALCAAQGIDVSTGHLGYPALAKGTAAAYRHIRSRVDQTVDDHYQARDVEAGRRMVGDGALLAAVELEIGALA